MTQDDNEVDRIMVDQSVLIARMLESIAQLGEVQKTVARPLIDLHMSPEHKILVSTDLTRTVNMLNRASHIIMAETIKNAKETMERDAQSQH